jgi:hypothetical protein
MRGGQGCRDLHPLEAYLKHPPRLSHGMLCIRTKIDEHLMHLGRIGQDSAGCRLDLRTDVDGRG